MVESGKTTANGLDAFYVLGETSDQNSGQTMRVLVYNIAYGNNIYQFLGLTDRSYFSRYRDTFIRTMRNFGPLNDASKLNRRGARIRIREVPRNMTLREALTSFGIPSSRHEEFAILNGLEVRQSVPAGSWLKIAK